MFSLKDASVPKNNIEIFLRSNILTSINEADN